METKHIFRSNFLKGGGIIHPELLEIGKDYLTYKKQTFLSGRKYSVTIYLKNIVTIESSLKFNGINLIIRTHERTIICRGLSRRKAGQIRLLIENVIENG